MVDHSAIANLKQSGEIPFVDQYVLLLSSPFRRGHEATTDPDIAREEPLHNATQKGFMCSSNLPSMTNEMVKRSELRVELPGIVLRDVFHRLRAFGCYSFLTHVLISVSLVAAQCAS